MVVKVVGTITKWCYKIIAFLLVLVIVKIIICPKVIYYIYHMIYTGWITTKYSDFD